MSSEGKLWFISGLLIGSLSTLVILFSPIFNDAYKRGQLDYQKGIVKYELTETGYKEVVTDE